MMELLKYVLLVDDDEAYNLFNKAILKLHNPQIKIETLTDGQELINHVTNTNEDKWPSIVFLDLNMDLVDGLEFLEWYHNNRHTGKMKIIIFSSSTVPETIEKCLAYKDVLGYFEKPLNKSKINDILKLTD